MDDPMDYVYHNRSELHPNHNQLPYAQHSQHSRCPYYNRGDSSYSGHSVFSQPLRSVGHGRYDPVHSSASPGHWHPGPQPPLTQWSGPGAMGMPGAPPRHYLLHPAGPPAGVSIPGPSMYPYPGQPSSHLPPVRSGYGSGPDAISHHSLPPPQTQALPNPNMFAHAGRGYANSPASRSSDPYNAALSLLPTSSQNAPPPESSSPSTESQPAPEPPSTSSTLETPAQLDQTTSPPRNIQFGSQPLSPDRPLRSEPTSTLEPPVDADLRVPSAPRLENIQFGSAPRLSTLVHPPATGGENRAPAPQASTPTETLPHPPAPATAGSSHRPSGSSNTSLPPFQTPPERRRTTTAARRTFSRRHSPPPERPDDPDIRYGDIRMFENLLAHNHRYMGLHDMEESRVRTAQFLRGSMSTKMVASSSAIQSLQSVAMSDLSESEKTCVICYNEFGVETPEGVKEAPLRLPKCKHVFGDHCIKKWFEESDSCPYCRDKMPSEPRITSTHPMMNRHMNRGWRETDPTHGASDSGLLPPGVGHGERRSPPTDSGEGRRRTRPRHSAGRGPGSPPFSATRPGSYGGSPAGTNEPRRGLNFRSNHPSNAPHRMGAALPFPYSGPVSTLAFGGPHDPTSSSTPGLYPPYTHHAISRGAPPIPQNGAFATQVNRNSLPTPGPGNWIIANAPRSEEQPRGNQPGDGIAASQGNGSSHWDSQ